MGNYIGCDLGTTYSVICLANKNFNFVKDEFGKNLVPSVVCYNEDLSVKYCGAEATDNEDNFPEYTVRSSKRYIGTQKLLIKESISAKNVAKDLFVYLKNLVEAQTCESIDGVVVTVPAYFNQNQRYETKLAAEEAGLNIIRIINEPTAAALAYGESSKQNELVLVYDLGGGTFDVTLLKLSEDNLYEVLSTAGDTKLGGDDFDNIIIESFKQSLPENFKSFNDFDVRLKKFAEEIKILLNHKTQINRTLKYCGTINNRLYHHKFQISSEDYRTMINQLLLRTKSYVLSALNDANKKISHLSKIILVGGSTKSKYVREFVENSFNTKVYYDIDPDLTVAFGAAKLAHTLSEKSIDGAVLIDVTPLSLGIETKGGLMNKIIHRNTPIPHSALNDYITSEDNQDEVIIRIYQGERPLVKDNEFLGEFLLSGFPQRPKGQTIISVKFEIDSSGLISVLAFDRLTGQNAQVTLSPLSADIIHSLENDLELGNDDKTIIENIEIDKLQKYAQSLIFKRVLLGEDEKELKETYNSLKDNLINLTIFVQDLEKI
jgi:molecular chaperone DnaK